MSRRPAKIDCRASVRNFILANFGARSFSTTTGVYTSLRRLFAKIRVSELGLLGCEKDSLNGSFPRNRELGLILS